MTKPNIIQLPSAQGSLSPTAFEISEKLSHDEWAEAGRTLAKIERSTMWWIGDWWAFGEHHYGERSSVVNGDDWDGPSFQTCQDAASVCRSFETSRRREVLGFNHHRELASLMREHPDEAVNLLHWCEEGIETDGKVRSIRALREQIKKIRAWLAQGWNTSQLERKAAVEGGEAVLANLTDDVDSALVAWADSQGLYQRIDRQSEWGNPYLMPDDGDRAEVCAWYAEYFSHKRSLHAKLGDLRGQVLGCWCYPQQCHGHVILDALTHGHHDS